MSTNLELVLDLARARTLVLRDIDHPLGSHHGLGLNDLAVLLELKAAPSQTLQRVELARRLAVTTSGIARQLAPLERIGLVGRESNPTDARLALVSCEFAGDIDTARAERARARAQHEIERRRARAEEDRDYRLTEGALQRALIRIQVAAKHHAI